MRMHNPICAIVLSVHVVSVVVSHAWALPGGCSVGPSVPLAPRNMPSAKQAEYYAALAQAAKRAEEEKKAAREAEDRRLKAERARGKAIDCVRSAGAEYLNVAAGLREDVAWLLEYDEGFSSKCDAHGREGHANPAKQDPAHELETIMARVGSSFDVEYARNGDGEAAASVSIERGVTEVAAWGRWIIDESHWISDYRLAWAQNHADVIMAKDKEKKLRREREEAALLAERIQMTKDKICRFEEGIAAYKQRSARGFSPKKLQDLQLVFGSRMMGLKDAWGTEFYYESDGPCYAISSAGPDGKFSTADDITVIHEKEQEVREKDRPMTDQHRERGGDPSGGF